MKNNKTSTIAFVAMFIATVSVLAVLNQLFLVYWPFPIKPTILHVPVIIASIVLGPRIGAGIGLWWGINSVITATITAGPTNFLFTPFQVVPGTDHGDVRALLIAIVPRILVGIFPYFIYKLFSRENYLGLLSAGVIGSATNTVFVLTAIFIMFGSVMKWDLQFLLSAIVATNSIVEAVLAAFLVASITPVLFKVYRK